MNNQVEEVGGGHFRIPESKTDPLDVWLGEEYSPETIDIFRSLISGGDQYSGHVAFIDTIKLDMELFSAVRDETYNHDQLIEMRSLVKYLSWLIGRTERVVKLTDKSPEQEHETDKHSKSNMY